MLSKNLHPVILILCLASPQVNGPPVSYSPNDIDNNSLRDLILIQTQKIIKTENMYDNYEWFISQITTLLATKKIEMTEKKYENDGPLTSRIIELHVKIQFNSSSGNNVVKNMTVFVAIMRYIPTVLLSTASFMEFDMFPAIKMIPTSIKSDRLRHLTIQKKLPLRNLNETYGRISHLDSICVFEDNLCYFFSISQTDASPYGSYTSYGIENNHWQSDNSQFFNQKPNLIFENILVLIIAFMVVYAFWQYLLPETPIREYHEGSSHEKYTAIYKDDNTSFMHLSGGWLIKYTYNKRNSHLSNCIINRIDQLRENELSKRGCFDIPYEIIGKTVKVDVPNVLCELSQDYIKKFEELHKKNVLITSTSKAYMGINYSFEGDDINVAFHSFGEKFDALLARAKAALREARNSLVDTNYEFRDQRKDRNVNNFNFNFDNNQQKQRLQTTV
ncbi:uncharacterized protein TRIADDRAFT_62520 [Trichoplax adhaerens]|uniref:Uncharacterized protein n=1 Tax=Trichoplax adhaerens TaxID=10228 RepID=B3SE13_TRIAD|nr:predicted protein [Trichoplax adhaerens]EDV19032.1 predicted protein [Trichoplax adhaerens]|eukprot:XP_002118482.1 predicted protein [Trichoplax adhaerens]